MSLCSLNLYLWYSTIDVRYKWEACKHVFIFLISTGKRLDFCSCTSDMVDGGWKNTGVFHTECDVWYAMLVLHWIYDILLLSLTAYCSLFAAMLVLFSLQSKASSSSSFSLSQMSSSVQWDTNTRKLSKQRSRHDECSYSNRNHSNSGFIFQPHLHTHPLHAHTFTPLTDRSLP